MRILTFFVNLGIKKSQYLIAVPEHLAQEDPALLYFLFDHWALVAHVPLEDLVGHLQTKIATCAQG